MNLQYVGKNQRAILRRSLRKFKPMALRVDDSTTWIDDLALQVLEEEITVDIPLRRIIEIMDKINIFVDMSEYAAIDKAWPGVLNEEEKEMWNELDRLSNMWEGKEVVERPSMPEYRQRELKLFMDDYKSSELLKLALENRK